MRPIQKLSGLCVHCHVAPRSNTDWLARGRAPPPRHAIRSKATTAPQRGAPEKPIAAAGAPAEGIDVDALLSEPLWSVRSLLPGATPAPASPAISASQLRHLLRLSALPPPKTAAEEAAMLRTLEDQLHFVREVRRVDTTGVRPLQALRDETDEGIAEMTIGLDALRDALAREEVRGRMGRPKRRTDEPVDTLGAEDWDVLGCAEKKVGRYFVVDINEGEGEGGNGTSGS